jgi:hypothetical protein
LEGVNPPINDDSEWYKLVEKEYEYHLQIPPTENFKFIYVGIESDSGKVLFRQDLTTYQPVVVAKFKTFHKPRMWVYWPVDKTTGEWVNRQDTNL